VEGELHPVIQDWLSWLLSNRHISPRTFRGYASDMRALMTFAVQQYRQPDPRQLTLQQLDAWTKYLAQEYAPASRRRMQAVLRGLFAWMHAREHIARDPTMLLGRPQPAVRLPRHLERTAVRQLLDSVSEATPDALRMRAILETLYAGGMRISEVQTLTMDALMLDQNIVRVLGKGNVERLCQLHDGAVRRLRAWLACRAMFLTARAWPDCGAVWINFTCGGPLHERTMSRLISEAADRAGIGSRVTAHMLRHSFATHMMERGADIRSLQLLLGHRSIQSTERYTHVAPETLRAVYRRTHPDA